MSEPLKLLMIVESGPLKLLRRVESGPLKLLIQYYKEEYTNHFLLTEGMKQRQAATLLNNV